MTRKTITFTGLAIFFGLAALYLLTYRGLHVSTDTLFMLDSTESFVRRGNFDLTFTFDRLESGRNRGQLTASHPWPKSSHEPLQPILAAPLFAIAQAVPPLGMMHTLWLFNVFVTAATGTLLYLGGIVLGYHERAALLGALIFGTATIAWPYTQTLFREPLMSFWALGATVAALWAGNRARSGGNLLLPLVLLGAAVGMAVLTKAAVLLIAPVFLLPLLPALRWLRLRGILLLVAVAVIALIATFALGAALDIPRLTLDRWLGYLDDMRWSKAPESIVGYFFSPGRSFLLFSPALLLAVPGAWILLRHRRWELPVGILLSLVIVAVVYSIVYSVWWGGNGWGPRYYVQFAPLLMLLALPALESLVTRPRRWPRLGAAVLVLLSVTVQLAGTLVSIDTYYDMLASQDILAWEEGMWSWYWSPIPSHLRLLDLSNLEVAWPHATRAGWVAVGLATLLLLLSGFSLLRHASAGRWTRRALYITMPALLSVGMGVGMYSLRDDARYYSNPQIPALVEAMDAHITRDDAVFIQPVNFRLTFFDQMRNAGLIAPLPYAPGENYDPDETPELADMPPGETLGKKSPEVMDWAAARYERVWLAVETSPEIPNELRPTEKYMSQNYYPIESFRQDLTHRAVSFYGLHAADSPSEASGVTFGDAIQLAGYSLPDGTRFLPGDIVPVSLFWEPLDDLTRDYLISMQIAQPGQPPVAQRDGLPQGTFGHTSSWEPGTTYADHHGLALPDDLPPGEYVLRVLWYSYPDLDRLPTPNGDTLTLATIQVGE